MRPPPKLILIDNEAGWKKPRAIFKLSRLRSKVLKMTMELSKMMPLKKNETDTMSSRVSSETWALKFQTLKVMLLDSKLISWPSKRSKLTTRDREEKPPRPKRSNVPLKPKVEPPRTDRESVREPKQS